MSTMFPTHIDRYCLSVCMCVSVCVCVSLYAKRLRGRGQKQTKEENLENKLEKSGEKFKFFCKKLKIVEGLVCVCVCVCVWGGGGGS